MINKEITRAYIKLHIAILLFGFTAILGKLITLQNMGLVWNRLWISFAGLLLLPGVVKGIKEIGKRQGLIFIGIGILVALHWVTFYGSIKLGDNASVTLACMATAPLFTSIVEPLIIKRRIFKTEVFLGLLTIVGIYFVTGVGSFYYAAMITGIVSAFLASLFSVLNKKYLQAYNTLSVSFIEFSSGWLFLCLLLPFYFYTNKEFSIMPQNLELVKPWHFQYLGIHSDWYYLMILGLLCTCLAFVFALHSLKYVSAFTANLSVNLEPVYGIILAALIFKENTELNIEFYTGTGIILSCVILHPILQGFEKRKLRNNG